MNRNRPPGLLTALCAIALLGLGAAAPSAMAATEWHVEVEQAPQNMPPTGAGIYVVHVLNVGDEASAGPFTLTATLPPGMAATGGKGENFGFFWDCSATTFPATTVECTYNFPVSAPGMHSKDRGALQEALEIAVETTGASGAASAEFTASGGGAPADATASVLTGFDPTPAGFGFVPGAFAANVFDSPWPAVSTERQAGSHPFEVRIDFALNKKLSLDPNDDPPSPYSEVDDHVRTLETRLPAGMIGNPRATPRCSADLLGTAGPNEKGICPANTQVGSMDLILSDGKAVASQNTTYDLPVFNMKPPAGAVAALATSFLGQPVWIVAELDPADRHSVVTRISHMTEVLWLRAAHMTLWGVPGDPAHDALRLNPNDPNFGATGMGFPFTGAPIKPFLTLPTQCDTPAGAIRQRADSWERPGAFTPWQVGASIQAGGCEDPRMRFEPSITIEPTSHEAASPTGLDVELSVPQKEEAVEDAADLYAESGKDVAINTPHVRTSVTNLPEGMAVNPSAADGLTGCSEAQIGLEDNNDPACPDSSKIGTVEIDSELMPETMKGFIYQARQKDNPFGSLLSFYTVAQGPGLTIKLAAEVRADPETGRLSTVFTDNPQLTFSKYRLHFWGGQRAPLVNPPTCGAYEGTGTVTSWNSSLPTAHVSDTVNITSGPGGAPCAKSLGERPFAPDFTAGSATPIAGAFTDFGLEVSRADGTQELRGLETTLPPGMLARLAGVPYCPEGSLASISTAAGTGLGERLAPSCPAASRVGSSDAAAGAGSLPFHNPGAVYLTGPYKNAPLGLAAVTPIVAGPLDLGSIVVRAALHVDPVTAQAKVVSDPIPDKLVVEGNGLPLNVRSVRVSMDRPQFTLNPTGCEETAVGARLTSLQGALAEPSERFQVGACAALGFKPRFYTRLYGGKRRGGHPKLRTVLQMPAGANIARAAVSLPRSVILDQANIRTVCTRVQFAADACPKASIYGRAAASSPLVDYVLRGPVYLRSSDDKLPNLVAVLRGPDHQPIEIELAGRIDTVRGGIRTVFPAVPDAAVSRFVLTMKGGKRQGLLQSTRNLCRGAGRALARFAAHNGRRASLRPRLNSSCGPKAKRSAQRRP